MLLKLLPLLLDTQMGLRLLPEGSWEQLLHNGLVLSPLLHRQLLLLPHSALLGAGGGVAAEPIKVTSYEPLAATWESSPSSSFLDAGKAAVQTAAAALVAANRDLFLLSSVFRHPAPLPAHVVGQFPWRLGMLLLLMMPLLLLLLLLLLILLLIPLPWKCSNQRQPAGSRTSRSLSEQP